jgi:hypothetical protein
MFTEGRPDCRAVATAGLWFQQSRSNKADKEEKQALMDQLKSMQGQLEVAGRQLVYSDRQHEETRKDLEASIRELKLEIRHHRAGHDQTNTTHDDLFSREQVWEIMAEEDSNKGGRMEMPRLRSDWDELLDRMKVEERDQRQLLFI